MRGLPEKIRRGLEHPRLPLALAFLAVLLASPSLKLGWVLDDQIHRAMFTASDAIPELERSPAEMFAFIDERRPVRDEMLPWWASDDLRLSFFRPLTGLTHWLDYTLWPESSMLMHAHSLLWFGLTVFAATVFFRRLAPDDGKWAFGLAALFFAVDDTHGLSAMWLAQRNTLLAVFFSLLTLIAYDRLRRDGWHPGKYLAPFCLALAVLSAEAAVACGAYLLAYALCLDPGKTRERLLALLPCAAVGVVWQVAYRVMGYGAAGNQIYVDPGVDPLHFLEVLLERAPVLLWGQIGFPPADFLAFFSQALRGQVVGVMVIALFLFALLLIPVLRHNATARFFAFGALLAVVPICATFPTQRLLFFVSLGTAGLLALFLAQTWKATETPTFQQFVARALTAPLLLVHLLHAPIALSTTSVGWSFFGNFFQQTAEGIPGDPSVETKRVMVANAPTFFLISFAPVYRALEGDSVPESLLLLSSGLFEVDIERTAARTLRIRPAGGFLAPPGSTPPDRPALAYDFRYVFQIFDAMFYDGSPFEVGQEIQRGHVSLEILSLTEDGRPAEIDFHFESDLEDPVWVWRRWQQGSLVEWTPPQLDETVVLPAPTF